MSPIANRDSSSSAVVSVVVLAIFALVVLLAFVCSSIQATPTADHNGWQVFRTKRGLRDLTETHEKKECPLNRKHNWKALMRKRKYRKLPAEYRQYEEKFREFYQAQETMQTLKGALVANPYMKNSERGLIKLTVEFVRRCLAMKLYDILSGHLTTFPKECCFLDVFKLVKQCREVDEPIITPRPVTTTKKPPPSSDEDKTTTKEPSDGSTSTSTSTSTTTTTTTTTTSKPTTTTSASTTTSTTTEAPNSSGSTTPAADIPPISPLKRSKKKKGKHTTTTTKKPEDDD